MKMYWGVEVQHHTFLTLVLEGGEWLSFTTQLLHPWYPLDRWLGGPQSQSWSSEEKNSQPLPGIKPPNPDHPASSQSLYWMSYPGSKMYLFFTQDILLVQHLFIQMTGLYPLMNNHPHCSS